MQTETLIRFFIATAIVTAVPGPNILLITSDSIRSGIRKGLLTTAGVSAGMIPLFAASIAGVSTIVMQSPGLFTLVQTMGAVYLVYLGGTILFGHEEKKQTNPSGRSFKNHFFLKGFLVSITNPKGLFFAGAFFPQFLNPQQQLMPQVLTLCSGCLFIATIIGALYAGFAGTANRFFESAAFQRHSARAIGSILILLGVVLFFSDKSRIL